MEEFYVEKTGQELDGLGVNWFQQCVGPHRYGAQAHMHDAVELIYIECGEYQIYVNGQEFEAVSGDVFLFRSNAIHSILTGNGEENRYYVLKFRPSVIFELSSEKNALQYVLRFVVSDRKGQIKWSVGNNCESGIAAALNSMTEAFQKEDICRDILLKICTGQIIYALLKEMLSKEEFPEENEEIKGSAFVQIYKAIRYINKNYAADIDARQISDMVGMSYSYFSRCFKKITARSFKEYLNEIRINRAEHLLVTTDLSVTQVAMECGYNNVSYFITVYKAIKNKTPYSNRRSGNESLS